MWAVAAAAVVALIVGASWWMAGSSRDSAIVAVTIDLRPFSVTRGDSQAPPPAPIGIPRARLDATIVLPLGAEAGTYHVQLRDPELSIRGQATGEAALANSVTSLRAPLDTTVVPAGSYRLEVRRVGGDWQYFPVTVK